MSPRVALCQNSAPCAGEAALTMRNAHMNFSSMHREVSLMTFRGNYSSLEMFAPGKLLSEVLSLVLCVVLDFPFHVLLANSSVASRSPPEIRLLLGGSESC